MTMWSRLRPFRASVILLAAGVTLWGCEAPPPPPPAKPVAVLDMPPPPPPPPPPAPKKRMRVVRKKPQQPTHIAEATTEEPPMPDQALMSTAGMNAAAVNTGAAVNPAPAPDAAVPAGSVQTEARQALSGLLHNDQQLVVDAQPRSNLVCGHVRKAHGKAAPFLVEFDSDGKVVRRFVEGQTPNDKDPAAFQDRLDCLE